MAVTQATRLGCGRDVDDVWDSIGNPSSEHEQTCPYCTQARASMAELSTATKEMTVADQQDPTLRVPSDRLAGIMAIVRTEVRRGRTIPLQRQVVVVEESRTSTTVPDEDRPGAHEKWTPNLTVSEQAIAAVVRHTCDLHLEVEAGRVTIETSPPSPSDETDTAAMPASGGVEPAHVVIDVQVTVSWTAAIPSLVQGLRRDIIAAVTSQIGVTTSRIDVHVQDVHDA